jgi:hypothetical protein
MDCNDSLIFSCINNKANGNQLMVDRFRQQQQQDKQQLEVYQLTADKIKNMKQEPL